MVATEAKLIDAAATNREPHHEPCGRLHWPEHSWMSHRFRRALGEIQEGGGAISECFDAASRMVPGDRESWHREWPATAERVRRRGGAAEAAGRLQTAQNCWLHAASYYRRAESWLDGPGQHDNPAIGQEMIGGWLAERFGIDERALRKAALA